MASKKDLKEVVRNYILENYSRLSEEDVDDDGIEDEVDPVVDEPENDDLESEQAFKNIIDLLDSTGQRVGAILRRADSTNEKVDILNRMVDFTLNGFTTREDLPNSMLRDFFIRKFGGGDVGDETMDEQSMTGGGAASQASFTAGTGEQYATPYAFRRKKKKK